MTSSAASSPLIVALDVPERDRILALAAALRDHVAMVKVGLEAFVAHGPKLVEELVATGVDVFLDLKLHDIPRTAAAAAKQASALGARLLTIHAGGGRAMIRAARDAAEEGTKIIAVTMLTSLEDADVAEMGFQSSLGHTAQRLGAMAMESGADGLVCSAVELTALAPLGGLRVVPGVRPPGADAADQRRVATPEHALRLGATWIVMGRPILEARDPVAAASRVLASLPRA